MLTRGFARRAVSAAQQATRSYTATSKPLRPTTTRNAIGIKKRGVLSTTTFGSQSRSHPSFSAKSTYTSTTTTTSQPITPHHTATKTFSTTTSVHTANQPTTPTTVAELAQQIRTTNLLTPTPTPLNQSSIMITALVGAAFGLGTAFITGGAWKRETKGVTTFADIDRILSEPEPNPYSFGTDNVDEAIQRQQKREHEYTSQDYALVMSLEEERMPIREKIDAIRQILLRQIEQTYPIYNLIESKLSYLNSNVIDAVYLQRAMEAKLFHRALGLPLDQTDVKYRVERDSTQQIINPEQLQHMRQNLVMTHDKAVHDFPTREQSEGLSDGEVRQIYQELAEFAMLSCVKLNYYKFVALLYNLETVIDDGDRALFDRMDTTVTADRNVSANAFTEAVDGLPQLSLRARTIIYRNKTMEVIANVLAQTEFVIDAIPQINDAIKTNIKTEIYRFARQSLQSPNDTLDTEELDQFVEQEWQRTKLDYSFVEGLHGEFYHTWLKLLFNNEERLSLLSDEELDNAYRYLRIEYLSAKAQEHTPRAFMEAYQVLKPLQYNELYNQAYLLLPQFDIEKPLAEGLMAAYQRVDKLEEEVREAGL